MKNSFFEMVFVFSFLLFVPGLSQAKLNCDSATLVANSKSVERVFVPQIRQVLFDTAQQARISLASSQVQLVKAHRGTNVYGAEGVTFSFRVTAVTAKGTKLRLSNGSDNTYDAGLRYFQIWMVADGFSSVGGSEGARLACTGVQYASSLQKLINESTGAKIFDASVQLRKWADDFFVPVTRR